MEASNTDTAAAETRSNTIICSVLFLDIVGYSKVSGKEQIALKKVFNDMLSNAIKGIPPDSMIILDTGDGAAVNFLSDIEAPVKAAVSLRTVLLKEGASMKPPLSVRMGINMGPGHIIEDINGRQNIVGDVINVAQRVMSFAGQEQILVSRSYYEAVSRLSPEYMEMFRHFGSHADKHVREHEVYLVINPDEPESASTNKQPTSDVPVSQPGQHSSAPSAGAPEIKPETSGSKAKKRGVFASIFLGIYNFFASIFRIAFGMVRLIIVGILLVVLVTLTVRYGQSVINYINMYAGDMTDKAVKTVDQGLKAVTPKNPPKNTKPGKSSENPKGTSN